MGLPTGVVIVCSPTVPFSSTPELLEGLSMPVVVSARLERARMPHLQPILECV